MCPYCGSTNAAPSRDGRCRHRCYDCKTSFSVTVGTIFHHTHLPLQKWFLAIMLMLNARKGPSTLQLSRDLLVNKNTAWRIAMQIRKAMSQAEQHSLLTGILKMDDIYIGDKPHNSTKRNSGSGRNRRGGGMNKAPEVGSIEHGGGVMAKAVAEDGMKGRHMRASVRKCVDAVRSHLRYVEGMVHISSIENSWALLKRGMFGQFRSVSQHHRQRNVDEFCCRYSPCQADPVAAWDLTINRGLGAVR